MAKNDKLINSMRAIAERNRYENIRAASERDTVQIYTVIALALWRSMDAPDDFKREFINSVFLESQEIWTKDYDKDLVAMCLKETGIELQNK